MKSKWISGFGTFMVAAMIAAPVFAQGGTSGSGAATGADPSKSPATKSSSNKQHGGAAASASEMMGRHTMEGEVTKIDQAKGMLSVKTAEGTLDLHFPPSALTNVKKGDHVAVELALKPSGSASMGGAASPATSDTGSKKSGSTSSGSKH